MISGKFNCALRKIKEVLTEHGFKEVWDNRGTLYEHKCLIDLKGTLHNPYSKNWFDKININNSDSKLPVHTKLVHTPNLNKTSKLKIIFLTLIILRKIYILQNFALVLMIYR